MLLPRVLLLLACQLLEGSYDTEAGVAWFDHVIDVTIACSVVRVAEEIIVFLLLLLCSLGALICIVNGVDFPQRPSPLCSQMAKRN